MNPFTRSSISHFNPRPPRGGRQREEAAAKAAAEFQSTPSSRRATDAVWPVGGAGQISIHALLAEGDAGTAVVAPFAIYFNPRPPRGGRLTKYIRCASM